MNSNKNKKNEEQDQHVIHCATERTGSLALLNMKNLVVKYIPVS